MSHSLDDVAVDTVERAQVDTLVDALVKATLEATAEQVAHLRALFAPLPGLDEQ